MSRVAEIQRLVHHYKDVTKKTEVMMHEAVDFAVANGWPLPKPIDPRDRLAREFSDALRQEMRFDKKTRLPYRVNHAVKDIRNGQQLTFWIDIDEAPRRPMHKSLVQRREQVVGDVLQMSLDMEHWNSIHPTEEPIALPLDFAFDVELRKNFPHGDEEAS